MNLAEAKEYAKRKHPQQATDHRTAGGKIAIVTGGAQGFGLALPQRCSQEGTSVVLADLNDAQAKERQRAWESGPSA